MIHQEVSPRTLGVVRALVFGLWIVNVWSVRLEDYLELPRELLTPYGLLKLIPPPLWDLLWTPAFLAGFRVALFAVLVWLVLGLGRYRAMAITACVMLTLFDGMAKSLGHLNHSKFAILFAAWILAAFPANDGFALRPRRGAPAPAAHYVAPMLAIATLIVVTYGFVGAYRIGKEGLGTFATDALGKWFMKRALEANATGFTLGLWIAERPPLLTLAKVGFAFVGMCELLAPLCLVSRYFRWFWIVVMVPFHFMSLFTMNIFFWENVLLILFCLTDSNRFLAPRGDGQARGSTRRFVV